VRPDLFDDEHTIVPDWDDRLVAWFERHPLAPALIVVVLLLAAGLVGQG